MANTLKFKSAKELQEKLKGFDSWLIEQGYPYRTLERLCEYLDCSRQTLLNYVNGLEKTIDGEEIDKIGLAILRAKRQLLADCVDRLYDKNTERGAEFLLKNNYGYTDKTDIGLDSSGLEIRLSPDLDKYSK